MVGSYWLPIWNHTFGIQWSHDRWRHVTRKVKVVTPIHLKLDIQYITSGVRPLWWSLVIVRDNYSCLVITLHHYRRTFSWNYKRVCITWPLTLTMSISWMQAHVGTVVCKFGSDPAISYGFWDIKLQRYLGHDLPSYRRLCENSPISVTMATKVGREKTRIAPLNSYSHHLQIFAIHYGQSSVANVRASNSTKWENFEIFENFEI